MDLKDTEEKSSKGRSLAEMFAEAATFCQKQLQILSMKECSEEFRVMAEWEANPNKISAKPKNKV